MQTRLDAPIPLVVDLDGTLVRSDTLVENWLRTLRRRPNLAIRAPLLLLQGKAHLKCKLATEGGIDVQRLPYNEAVLEFLREQHSIGRKLILATASDQRIAEAIASHLGIFEEVMASDGITNLRGQHKARALREKLGPQGFVYAGNDRHDIPVWNEAARAVLVDVPPRVRRLVTQPVEKEFSSDVSRWQELFRAMRPYQWVKNLLVFLPLITANAFGNSSAWVSAAIAFAAFSLVASGVYLLNDLADLDADRAHPDKRFRPSASGKLPLEISLAAGPILTLAGVVLAFASGPKLAGIILLYFVITLTYSLVAKRLPLVDVFLLAFLYTLRVIGGGFATGYSPSIWLLTFCCFFFLALAFAKRYAEVSHMSENKRLARRGYQQSDGQVLVMMGTASSFAAAIVLALYVDSSGAAEVWNNPFAIWAFVPLSLFWQCRIWLSASRGHLDHDPILYAWKDWVSWIALACAVAIYIVAA